VRLLRKFTGSGKQHGATCPHPFFSIRFMFFLFH
jgi:hypothetical protein